MRVKKSSAHTYEKPINTKCVHKKGTGLGVIVQQNSGAKIEYMVFTVYSTTY